MTTTKGTLRVNDSNWPMESQGLYRIPGLRVSFEKLRNRTSKARILGEKDWISDTDLIALHTSMDMVVETVSDIMECIRQLKEKNDHVASM